MDGKKAAQCSDLQGKAVVAETARKTPPVSSHPAQRCPDWFRSTQLAVAPLHPFQPPLQQRFLLSPQNKALWCRRLGEAENRDRTARGRQKVLTYSH